MRAVLEELHAQDWPSKRSDAELTVDKWGRLPATDFHALVECLAESGLDDDSIAQADEDDWDDFDVCVHDGLVVQRALRRRLRYYV
jgi:hypothetical protein